MFLIPLRFLKPKKRQKKLKIIPIKNNQESQKHRVFKVLGAVIHSLLITVFTLFLPTLIQYYIYVYYSKPQR